MTAIKSSIDLSRVRDFDPHALHLDREVETGICITSDFCIWSRDPAQLEKLAQVLEDAAADMRRAAAKKEDALDEAAIPAAHSRAASGECRANCLATKTAHYVDDGLDEAAIPPKPPTFDMVSWVNDMLPGHSRNATGRCYPHCLACSREHREAGT